MTDKVSRFVAKVLAEETPPPEWSSSRLDLILKDLPADYSNKLAALTVRRAVQFRQEYGIQGDADFPVLLDFFYSREEDLSREWAKGTKAPEVMRKVTGAIVDSCAVLALTSNGVRVGNHWIDIHKKVTAARTRSK